MASVPFAHWSRLTPTFADALVAPTARKRAHVAHRAMTRRLTRPARGDAVVSQCRRVLGFMRVRPPYRCAARGGAPRESLSNVRWAPKRGKGRFALPWGLAFYPPVLGALFGRVPSLRREHHPAVRAEQWV